MIDQFTADDFSPLVGQTVVFDQPDYQETLTVSQVIRTRAPAVQGFRQGFSVILDGSNPGVMIEQGLYALNIPGLGRHDLLIGCVGKTEAGAFQYQMVFN